MDDDALYVAAILGDADADTVNEYGETILHIESRKGNTERVRSILRKFESKNLLIKLGKGKETALAGAACNGHTKVVELLIDAARRLPPSANNNNLVSSFQDFLRHADPNNNNPVSSFQDFLRHADQVSWTALHYAAMKGHTAIAKLLVEADPSHKHIQNIEGKTPIYLAAERGYNDIIKVICTTCTALCLDGPHGSTALHAAIKNLDQAGKKDDVVRMIFNAAKRSPHVSFEALINKTDQSGHSILELAVMGDHVNLVDLILKEDPAAPHKAGAALILAIKMHKAGKKDDVVRMIINAAKRSPHVSFEALFNKTDESGYTILELAARGDHMKLVDLILKEDPAYQHGSTSKTNGLRRLIYKPNDEECKDIVELLCKTCETAGHKGALALILAIKRRDKDSVLRLLGDAKHLATFADDDGWTPLHYAAGLEFDSVLDAIVQAQKDSGYQFNYRAAITPLLVAAEKGYSSTVIRLMQLWPASSSACTATNSYGRNILHLAAAKNKKEMIQGILKYCPEKYKDKILKQQDKDGNTPLHRLISHGCFIPELIKHKGLDTMAKNKRNYTPRDMLYFDDKIIADQVQIKIALDDIQTTHSWKFWGKSTEKKTDILESSVLPSKRERKDVLFNERTKLLMEEKSSRMKKDLERYKKRTNTQIIVTALITTVTFTVGFTMPGGLHQSGELDEGLVVLTRKAAFKAFVVSDALALLLSTCSLFLYFLESMYEDPHEVSKLNAASVGLNIVSIMAMMLTFITGTYLVLSHSLPLAITVCLIGSFFFIFVIVLLIKLVYYRQAKRNED